MRVVLVSGSASDDEDVKGAFEELVMMVVGIVVGLASDETESESSCEVVMAVV